MENSKRKEEERKFLNKSFLIFKLIFKNIKKKLFLLIFIPPPIHTHTLQGTEKKFVFKIRMKLAMENFSYVVDKDLTKRMEGEETKS